MAIVDGHLLGCLLTEVHFVVNESEELINRLEFLAVDPVSITTGKTVGLFLVLIEHRKR
jgi:hypothetical protein